MGNRNTKSSLRNAIVYLNISADEISLDNDKFWAQIWNEDSTSAIGVLKGISLQEVRMLRDGSPKNFASLTYKMVERLYLATGTLCNTHSQQTAVLNATRILIRIIPCIYEDKDWRNFFLENQLDNSSEKFELKFPSNKGKNKNYKAYLPSSMEQNISRITIDEDNYIEEEEEEGEAAVDKSEETKSTECELLNLNCENCEQKDNEQDTNIDATSHNILEKNKEKNLELFDRSLLKILILSICDLLFCPEFTVLPHNNNHLADAPPEDLKSLITCEYVWEPGVGFDSNSNSTTYYDKSRIELLRLLLTCCSENLYYSPQDSIRHRNCWLEILVSHDNRHALPLFTSLLNTIFIYKPTKATAFNRLLYDDNRQELVELCVHVMIATLDYQIVNPASSTTNIEPEDVKSDGIIKNNLFIEYLSRIHRSEDLTFLVKGFARLLNNCLEQSYLLSSSKHIDFDQELLILLWNLLNLNTKFVHYLLKSNDILEVVVPILHHLNENFQDTTKSGLIHIGVFNLLILSGERNFGVLLNKPYSANVLMNLPTFTGSHADLLIIVFHKLILYGFNMNSIIDYLITIVVNVSPFIKALSMLASKCLIQLFEIFSSPFIIFTEPNLHKLITLLLEIFNNLIQYQFDGNANLVYVILTHKEAFLNLSNLPSTSVAIEKVLNKLVKRKRKERLMNEAFSNQDNKDNQNTTKTLSGDIMAGPIISNQTSIQSCPVSKDSRIEVSLIETPSICKVTLATHLFNEDNNEINKSNTITTTANNNNSEVQSSNAKHPSISFDDILNDDTSAIEEDNVKSTNQGLIIKMTSNNHSELKECSVFESTHEQGPSTSSTENQSETKNTQQQQHKQNKWKPTSDWVKEWKKSLPLQTILRMIEVLLPQIERFRDENKEGGGQQDVLETIKFLQNGTLVGLLPVPHPIMIRKYHTNKETTLWFRICTWGVIYVRQIAWLGTRIKLIKIM